MRFRSIPVIAAGCALVSGCTFLPQPGATLQSRQLYQTWTIFSYTAAFVAAIVYGLIAWCVLRYRARPGDDGEGPQFRTNNALEITYTIIPLVMVGGLFAVTYPSEHQAETLAPSQALVVDVVAYRWSWRFNYPSLGLSVMGTPQDPPRLVLPLDETTRINLESADVAHAFWVPAFLFKRDAIPGYQNHFDWTPHRLGTFRGECGEFCGLDHALMTFNVAVVSPTDFARWAASQRTHAPPLGSEPQ